MKTACVALAGVASATAFVAPSAFTGAQLTAAPTSSAMKMSFEGAEGAQPPLGFFDPLGLLDGADEERFARLRYVEVKHGRIAMLAVVGHLYQNEHRFGGYLSPSNNLKFTDLPNGFGAFGKIPPAGFLQIVAFIGFLELVVMKQVEGSTPGDMNRFGTNPVWKGWSEEKKSQKRSIELNNGRAAQMGILGIMVHEVLTGSPYVIQDILGKHVPFNGV